MYKTARNLTVLGIGLGTSAVVGWLLLRESKRQDINDTVTVKSQRNAGDAEEMEIVLPLDELDDEDGILLATSEQPDEKDDLTKINDIGPRFAEALAALGITTFAQLAQETPDALAERLSAYVTVRAQRIRDKNWIGQAAQLATH
jgi:predicted flap endonuclease-1-like 5' DNA nuclease